jgi:peptide/nickel transport system substrate-binding protein
MAMRFQPRDHRRTARDLARRPLRLVAAAATVAAAALLVPVGASAQSPSDEAPVVLRVGTTADLITDNPWAVSAGSDWSVVTIQYDMLLKFAPENLSPAPSLATGCEPNADSTEWTCTLRDGLMWSDGTPLTSKDVAFTYRVVIDNKIPQYRSYFPFDPTFETPDDTTLIWKSTKPTFAPDMPPWVYIVPEKVWAPYDGKGLAEIKGVENTPTIASGPFTLTEWNQGRNWTMEKNPYYWGPEPTVDRIEFQLYSNQEALITALRNGQIDFADGIKPSLVQSVQGIDDVTVQTGG